MSNCNSYRAPPWSGFRTEFDKQLQAKFSTCDSVIPCPRTVPVVPSVPVIPTKPVMPSPMPVMPSPMPVMPSPMPVRPSPMPVRPSPMPRSPMPSPMGTKLGAPEMHTCADGTMFECAGGTQGCMDNSPMYC